MIIQVKAIDSTSGVTAMGLQSALFCLLTGLQIPGFNKLNIFLQRISNPLGRLAVDIRDILIKVAKMLATFFSILCFLFIF